MARAYRRAGRPATDRLPSPTRRSPPSLGWGPIPSRATTGPKTGGPPPSWPVVVVAPGDSRRCWSYHLVLLRGEGLRGFRSKMGRA